MGHKPFDSNNCHRNTTMHHSFGSEDNTIDPCVRLCRFFLSNQKQTEKPWSYFTWKPCYISVFGAALIFMLHNIINKRGFLSRSAHFFQWVALTVKSHGRMLHRPHFNVHPYDADLYSRNIDHNGAYILEKTDAWVKSCLHSIIVRAHDFV